MEPWFWLIATVITVAIVTVVWYGVTAIMIIA